jgi:hypothetical protein
MVKFFISPFSIAVTFILSFIGMDINQLKNMYKLKLYTNLSYNLESACTKIKMNLIHFIKQLSVYEMILFGQFCLQHKVLEEYRSVVCYKGEKDWDCSLMTISILIEKHTEMKQKQMKCSVFHSFVQACQKQIVKVLYNYQITKKEACMIKDYINKK